MCVDAMSQVCRLYVNVTCSGRGGYRISVRGGPGLCR